MDLETKRLNAAGQKQLANRVEHISVEQGDGLGYDILSYETSGQERFIEVKTTAFGSATPFYVTHNELLRSEIDSDNYYIYRIFNFRSRPQLFSLHGTISMHCHLEAINYLAYV